jgi:hypothetical protein
VAGGGGGRRYLSNFAQSSKNRLTIEHQVTIFPSKSRELVQVGTTN